MHRQRARRVPLLLAVTLSIVIHALGLWMLIYRAPSMETHPPADTRGPLVVSLLSPPVQTPAPAKEPSPARAQPRQSAPPPSRPAPARRHAPAGKKARNPTVARASPPATLGPPPAPAPRPDSSSPQLAPSDDMFTQLEAARKRRADALAKEQSTEQSMVEDDAQRANRVALANIAEAVNKARAPMQNNHGGVFSIRRLGYHDAEFMFYGWSTNSRRNVSRLVVVEQGAETDIQTAVVRKMIEIIREQKKGDFVWESHRLGRSLTLNASPEHQQELEQFLLREFFYDYPARP